MEPNLEELRALRKSRGVTQEELAKLAHVTASTVYALERKLTKPHAGTLRKLSAALKRLPDHNQLSEQARSIQWNRGWSHQECARLSGISHDAWHRRVWKRSHKAKPHRKTTAKLAEFVAKYSVATV